MMTNYSTPETDRSQPEPKEPPRTTTDELGTSNIGLLDESELSDAKGSEGVDAAVRKSRLHGSSRPVQ